MRAMAMVLSVVLALVPGCSFLTVRGAPSTDPGVRPVDCTRSVFAPVVDTVPAAVFLGIATAILVDIKDSGEGDEGRVLVGGMAAIVFGLPGLPFAASAIYGYRKTGRCRAMNAAPLPVAPAPPASGPPGDR